MNNNTLKKLLVANFNDVNINIYGTTETPLFKVDEIIRVFGEDTIVLQSNDIKNKELITEIDVYEIIINSGNPISKQFRKWIREILVTLRLREKSKLKEELKLEYKKEFEKSYTEIHKNGSVYIIKTDTDMFYKVGKTRDVVKKRIKNLQTANVNDIKILLDFKTHNPDLLEKCVHYILDRYRCDSNREFFDTDINYINLVIIILGTVLDTLKSSYSNISKTDLLNKLNEKLGTALIEKHIINDKNFNDEDCDELESKNDFYNFLKDNLEYRKNSYLQVKDVLQIYKVEEVNCHSSIKSTYRKQIEKYIRNTYISKNIKWKYGSIKVMDKTYKGWKDISIIKNR
jgi:hypothetical protein